MGDWLCTKKYLRGGEQIDKNVRRAIFALKRATIGKGGASLSIGGDAAAGFSGFSEWYFLSSCRKLETSSISSQVSFL